MCISTMKVFRLKRFLWHPMKADFCVHSIHKTQNTNCKWIQSKRRERLIYKKLSHKTHGVTGPANVKCPNFDQKNLWSQTSAPIRPMKSILKINSSQCRPCLDYGKITYFTLHELSSFKCKILRPMYSIRWGDSTTVLVVIAASRMATWNVKVEVMAQCVRCPWSSKRSSFKCQT